jgi:uncharacterized protein DUF3592
VYLKGGSIPGALAVLSRILAEMSTTLLVLGAALLTRAVWLWRRAKEIAGWPTVPGSITRARVESRKRKPLSTDRVTKSRYYRPEVIYTYAVNGTRFEGRGVRLANEGWKLERTTAESIVTPYAAGQTVSVKYNPGRPGDSVLEEGLGPLWRQAIVLSAICLVLGLYGWLVA